VFSSPPTFVHAVFPSEHVDAVVESPSILVEFNALTLHSTVTLSCSAPLSHDDCQGT
jgi:hypothetical protein